MSNFLNPSLHKSINSWLPEGAKVEFGYVPPEEYRGLYTQVLNKDRNLAGRMGLPGSSPFESGNAAWVTFPSDTARQKAEKEAISRGLYLDPDSNMVTFAGDRFKRNNGQPKKAMTHSDLLELAVGSMHNDPTTVGRYQQPTSMHPDPLRLPPTNPPDTTASNETQPVDTEVPVFSHSWEDIHVQGQQNLRGSEGERSYVYDDHKDRPGTTQEQNGWATLSGGLHVDGLTALGNPTIGWGHLVTDADRDGKSHVATEILGRAIDINDPTFSISSTEAENIFQYDYDRHSRGVRFISNIEDLSNDLISHVIDFIFNKGPDVFNPTIKGNWKLLRGAIENRNWDAAVEQVEEDWHVQRSRKDAFINSLLREAQFDNLPISTQPVPETVN